MLGQDERGQCNNGCERCLTLAVEGDAAAFTRDVRRRHVLVRHREPTLRADLAALVAELRRRGAASVSLLTNGRALVYPALGRRLLAAGLGRIVVKLFACDAGEHDGHARVPGAFAQALDGIAAARQLGAEVRLTFPLPARTQDELAARLALAHRLTGADPVVMPGAAPSSGDEEYRYDVVALRGRLVHPAWTESFFPMVHILTGPACNLRCAYCNVEGGTDGRLHPRAVIERLIDDAARRILPAEVGCPTVDLIGGEPTLHPELCELVRYARAAGFPKVYICTNGLRLTEPGLLEALRRAGLTGVRLSLPEHRAALASRLGDVAGIGERQLEAARLLLGQRELHVHLFRLVLRDTIDALGDYVRWLVSINHTGAPLDLTFGLPSLRGRLHRNPELYPPLSGLREKIAAAVEVARGLGVEPLFHHTPACLYPDEPARSACLHIATLQYDTTGRQEETSFEGDARHGRACQACTGRLDGCHGLPATYFERDGEAAEAWLVPIRYRPERVAG